MSFSQATAMMVDKGNHRHFMAKEIEEQPEVVGHTLAEYIDFATRTVRVPEKLPFDFAKLDRIAIVACGTVSSSGVNHAVAVPNLAKTAPTRWNFALRSWLRVSTSRWSCG